MSFKIMEEITVKGQHAFYVGCSSHGGHYVMFKNPKDGWTEYQPTTLFDHQVRNVCVSLGLTQGFWYCYHINEVTRGHL